MFEKQVLSRQFADSLEKVGTEFWAWRMSNSREFSTSLGQYKYNDLLDSYSYQKLEENKVALFSLIKWFRIVCTQFGNILLHKNALTWTNMLGYDMHVNANDNCVKC